MLDSLSLSLSKQGEGIRGKGERKDSLRFFPLKFILPLFSFIFPLILLSPLIIPLSPVLAKSQTKIITGTVSSIDTENSLITIQKTLRKKEIGPAPFYTINYYAASKFSRASGGRLTEAEIQIGDQIKTTTKLVGNDYFAKKLTDLSIRYTKITGSLGDVSDTEDTFLIQTKKGTVTVNLEDNTDTIHKPMRQKNNPLTKAQALGLFNSNTMKMYGTRSLTIWSR